MAIVITAVKLSKNPVKTGEQFKISVSVKETVQEPNMYRLPFKLGTKTGEQFKISVSVKETVQEPNMYRLPFKLGTKKGGIK